MSALRGNAVFKEAQFLRPRAELAQVRGLSKLWGWSSRRPGALLHMQKFNLKKAKNPLCREASKAADRRRELGGVVQSLVWRARARRQSSRPVDFPHDRKLKSKKPYEADGICSAELSRFEPDRSSKTGCPRHGRSPGRSCQERHRGRPHGRRGLVAESWPRRI
jgi:hypothetical protein